jgi:hypothetical protein
MSEMMKRTRTGKGRRQKDLTKVRRKKDEGKRPRQEEGRGMNYEAWEGLKVES